MTVPPPPDLLGAAMADFAAGRPLPLWRRVAPEPRRAQGRRRQDGRRLAHGLAACFAPAAAGWRLDQAQAAGGRYWAVARTASASRSTWSRSATVGSKISSSTPAAAKASAISLTASGVRDAPEATPSAQSPRNP
jgi:hypothetical protein